MKTIALFLCSSILCIANMLSQEVISIKNTFNSDTNLNIFSEVPAFYGFRIKCTSTMSTDTSLIRIILKNTDGNEFLIYEDYALIHNEYFSNVNNFGEETFYLPTLKSIIKNKFV